jgi:hypothetical protein
MLHYLRMAVVYLWWALSSFIRRHVTSRKAYRMEKELRVMPKFWWVSAMHAFRMIWAVRPMLFSPITILLPSRNLGCLGIKIGSMRGGQFLYADIFNTGAKGIFWRVPKSRNWLFVSSRWPFLKYKHDPMI